MAIWSSSAPLAQLVEQRPFKPLVPRSSRGGSTVLNAQGTDILGGGLCRKYGRLLYSYLLYYSVAF